MSTITSTGIVGIIQGSKSADFRRLNEHLLNPGAVPQPSCPSPRNNGAGIAQGTGRKRIQQKNGDGMNRTERRYDALLRESWDYVYREPALPLANGLKYKLDFLVVGNEGRIEGHEVKGRAYAAGIAKVKMAARLFPWIKFYLVTAQKGGTWQLEPVLP